MSKKLAIPLIVAAFIIGVIGGGWYVAHAYNHFTSNLICNNAGAEIGGEVHVLDLLRKNDITNAVDLMEVNLNGSLETLGLFITTDPKEEIDSNTVKMLRIGKAYRDKYPFNSDDPSVDQIVSNALLQVATSK
jgi:hypothetical protein